MTKANLARTLAGLTVALSATVSGTAFAQGWTPGAEIVGQPISVTTNGVTNTVTLNPGGQAVITSPGGRVVNGTWTAANGQLCISAGGPQECVPYTNPFQAGMPKDLTSSCGALEKWLAENTNQMPTQGEQGERGR